MSYDNFDEDETWQDWLIIIAAAAFTAWFILDVIIGADHLIEVISNWFVG